MSEFIQIDANGALEVFNKLDFTLKEKKALVREGVKPLNQGVRASFRAKIGRDPRKAIQGIHSTVYRSGGGGNVSILNSRKRGKFAAKVERTSGRKKRAKSARTLQVESYYGKDRAFILRFLNQGTKQRTAGRYGNRGRVVARGFFDSGIINSQNKALAAMQAFADKKIAEKMK